MTQTRLVLLTPLTGGGLQRLAHAFGDDVQIEVIRDLSGLLAVDFDRETTLVSFGAGVIVPGDVLARLHKPAYNMHAAIPAFPGRDAHHHAIYRKSDVYGATLHVMTARVDDGPIVGVETFQVAAGTKPRELLSQANEAGFRLVERLGRQLLDAEPLPALSGVVWGAEKTRRSDLVRLCRLTPLVTEEEFSRRYLAFDGEAYDNLAFELHGHLFRIDKTPRSPSDTTAFADFTEAGFRALLLALKAADYRFVRYGEACPDRHVIWRHDVDFSMHRAARLAEIEAEEGVLATYFVNPHCTFYNLLEPEIMRLVAKIRDLGHEIGLHFDAGSYDARRWEQPAVDHALARERTLLEAILDAPVRSVSWHNPDLANLLDFDADEIGGLVNAYGASLKRDYTYCSDSNGYWRFQPMADVIAAGHPRLHLLTHPAWWTPEPMPPSERIDRAIMGRARAVRRDYDAMLARGGRRNVAK